MCGFRGEMGYTGVTDTNTTDFMGFHYLEEADRTLFLNPLLLEWTDLFFFK